MSSRQIPLTCPGHTRPVVDLAFSGITQYGSFIISASKDGLPMLRAGDTGDWVGTFEGHKGAVWSATLTDDATCAATGAADYSAKLWGAVNGECLATYSHSHIVKAVAFTNDKTRLISGCQNKQVYLCSCENPEAEKELLKKHNSMVKRVCCSGNDNLVFSTSEESCISVWDLRSNEEVKSIPASNAVTSLELSRDKTLLAACHDRIVTVYDVDTLSPVRELKMPSKMYSASLHPDKTTIVAGGEDLKVYKFDYATGEQLEAYKGHFGPIHAIRYSPDGEVYSSGSEDGTLRLWQNTVGKTYGLWVTEGGAESAEDTGTPPPADA